MKTTLSRRSQHASRHDRKRESSLKLTKKDGVAACILVTKGRESQYAV